MRRALPALLLLLSVSACSSADEAATDEARPSAPAASAPAPGVPADSPSAGLVPTADGLVVRASVGRQALEFGSAKADVIGALDAVLGPQDSEREVSCPQGERTSTSFGGQQFRVLFDDEGAFVGWDARGVEIVTDTGLRVGSTRAEVERALPGTAFDDRTPGPGFGGGEGIGGLLDGDAPTATVTRLTGGEDCDAR